MKFKIFLIILPLLLSGCVLEGIRQLEGGGNYRQIFKHEPQYYYKLINTGCDIYDNWGNANKELNIDYLPEYVNIENALWQLDKKKIKELK